MSNIVDGLTLDQWAAAYRPGIVETAAETFVYTPAGDGLRIAFGNAGPVVDEKGSRVPVFHHAVSTPAHLAVELARLILAHYAAPGRAAGFVPPQP